MTVLVLSTVLTAGIILITIFTRDLKVSTETILSAQALYAADSEIERLSYYKFNLEDLPPLINYKYSVQTKYCMKPLKNLSDVNIGIEECLSCENDNADCIKASGQIGSVERNMEVYFIRDVAP